MPTEIYQRFQHIIYCSPQRLPQPVKYPDTYNSVLGSLPDASETCLGAFLSVNGRHIAVEHVVHMDI